ncbi:DivIVA domain-containing protein [Cellulomonas sp. ATA003]|uniref:DivIVA domain-containing protein n=1 Tax=Cellulomonas sp. ATA003 TaxID=3073064 RepID=UPI0037BFDD71
MVVALRAHPAGAPPEAPATRPVTTGALAAAAVAGSGAWVRDARAELVPVRLRAGYVRREVDPVLDRAARELDARGRGDARRMTARDVRDARFTVTRWRTGYPQADVDALLARVALALGD